MADATLLSVMSKQIEDNKQATDDLKAQMADLRKRKSHIEAMLSKLVSTSSGQTSRASGLNASPSGCLTNSMMTPLLPEPPDPPDFNQFGQRLSKLEFPVFDGTLLDCWIAKVDRIFELEQYGNEEKLDFISLSLEGAALKWFRKHRREFTDWTYMKRKLMARFGLVKGYSPPEVLPKEKFITKVDQDTDFGSEKESTNSVEITSIKGHEVQGTTASHVRQFDVTTIADAVGIAKCCESSLLQHSSATRSRASFNPYQNCNDQCRYKREFGNYTGHEIEFDRECEEIEDDELKDKQPEEDVETLVVSENEQSLECVDDESPVDEKLIEVIAEETALEPMDESGCNVGKERNLNSLLLPESQIILLHIETIRKIGLIQEHEPTDAILEVNCIHSQEFSSQFQVPIPSLEPSCRCRKESLVVVNDLSSNLGCVIGKTIGCNCDSEIGQDTFDEEEFNRVWEPGGVFIEHDKWQGSEKCHELSIVVRLMQGLPSTRWSYGKVAELTQELQQTKTYLKGIKLKDLDRLAACSCVDTKTWHCVKHETQQTDFHVWHRWKNKAEKLPANYALLELMMLGLVSFQPNKGNVVVGLVPKAIVLREVSHCRSNDYGTISHNLLLVRDTSSNGYKEDSWSFIWFILKELCSAGFERNKETMKENFKGLSKLEKDHELLSPENLDVHTLYLFRKRGFIEFSGCHTHLKKLRAALEKLPQEFSEELAKRIVIGQKIAGRLIYGDVKFHLKHKWRSRLLQTLSRLEFCVDNAILFTSFVKLLFLKNHKLLPYEAEFCTQYNDLKQLSTEFQSFPDLDYFAYLIFIWNQTLNCGCEAGYISSGFFSVGDVHGDETHSKRLLVLREIPLLNNDNKGDLTFKANWFYNKPMIREVFHLQRPPELIDLQGNPNCITKVLVQWKEHPPDQSPAQATWEFYSNFISKFPSFSHT